MRFCSTHHRALNAWVCSPGRFVAVAAFLCVALVAGCTDRSSTWRGGDQYISGSEGTISISELAGRLNMTVAEHSGSVATLRDSVNVVLVFADPDGQVYVNGEVTGEPGGIKLQNQTLLVPQNLEGEIRLALRVSSRLRQGITHTEPRRDIRAIGSVVLDAGHGGRDPGAISILGTQEKTIVLDTTLVVAERLRAAGCP